MITVRQIQERVCRYFDMTHLEMLTQNRSHRYTRPRQIAMMLARETTGKSLTALGTAFCRDHTTVLTACRAVWRLEQIPQWATAISELRADIADPEGSARRDYEILMHRRWKASVPHCYAPGAYADEALCRSFIAEEAIG